MSKEGSNKVLVLRANRLQRQRPRLINLSLLVDKLVLKPCENFDVAIWHSHALHFGFVLDASSPTKLPPVDLLLLPSALAAQVEALFETRYLFSPVEDEETSHIGENGIIGWLKMGRGSSELGVVDVKRVAVVG